MYKPAYSILSPICPQKIKVSVRNNKSISRYFKFTKKLLVIITNNLIRRENSILLNHLLLKRLQNPLTNWVQRSAKHNLQGVFQKRKALNRSFHSLNGKQGLMTNDWQNVPRWSQEGNQIRQMKELPSCTLMLRSQQNVKELHWHKDTYVD